MADFTHKTFIKHDDYMTPKSAWESIQHLVPKDKVIWECFYGDGESGKILTELGYTVIHEPIDFYKENRGDILLSNPPFGDCKNIMPRLKALGKPFIFLMPSSKINTQYFRDSFKGEDIQIIIPAKRINFIKLKDGKKQETNSCNFDCFYYCWKIGLEKDITWLE